MDFKDYYKILDVAPDADVKTIKTAYRRLARKYHPDVSDASDAEQRFKEVAEAYEVLSDEKKRTEYDQLRQYGSAGQQFEPPPGWQGGGGAQGNPFDGHSDFSDFFENIFGGGRSRQGFNQGGRDFNAARGSDVEVDLALFLEDTQTDASRTIEYNLPRSGPQGETRKTLKVKIPAGVADGERIRLKGQGSPGFGGAPAGDLYLRIRLAPHPLFDVSGHDLIVTVPLAPWEAALGAKVTVPTLSGKISLSISPNSQTGQRLRIKGQGLKTRKSQGDLYAVLKIVMPPRSSKEAEPLWQELAKKAHFNPRSEWEK